MQVISADIGGTHISVASVHWKDGQALVGSSYHQDINTSQTAEAIIAEWSKAIQQVSGSRSDFYLGISMPGPYDYENGISLIKTQGKMRSLYGLSVKNLLSQKLGISSDSILFTNDAECFLIGEGLVGAGKGCDKLIGLTLGTGLGSAIRIEDVTKDAKLWTAPFRSGIAEDYLGTQWFVTKVKEAYGIQIEGVKDLLSPNVDPQLISPVFKEFGKTLGEFLLPYVSKLQVQKVILGGKISLSGDLFIPSTQEYLSNFGINLPVEISRLGENAALIGASSVFFPKLPSHEH
jgi:glucokinase